MAKPQHTTNPPAEPTDVRYDVSRLTEDDLHLFNQGRHFHLYEKLGAHLHTRDGEDGVYFAVWAPNAESLTVIGDFNGWNRDRHPLHPRGGSGIWEGFIPGIGAGAIYKYFIRSRFDGYQVEKADPFARYAEVPPRTGSVVWGHNYPWADGEWMQSRAARNGLDAPMSVYEVHLGSWRRVPEEGNRSLSYQELATQLADHVKALGFTHVELMPVMEHPFFGSWGYQCTGYFAPTSRYGTPQDFMHLVDALHREGIGVILDWVPSHFPTDEHGLGYFDGTHLYEHSLPSQGLHPEWGSAIYNYGRNEVRSFLISNARFWLDHYHADGLRVDAVASMLYLDYARKEGEWIPNQHGGRENLEAIDFLRQCNEAVYLTHPDTQSIAEESTAWPMVSRPTSLGGLGFGLKWDMGWMHDTLDYLSKEPVHRSYHHGQLTFHMLYAFTENYMLPLSHDEVVHGKGSLLGKMPGGPWQQFANLRLLYACMYAQPGKKLLFMGAEIGQGREWNHDGSLDWDLLQYPFQAGVQRWLSELNRFYRYEPSMHQLDTQPSGFEWIDCNDAQGSTISLLRWSKDQQDVVAAAFNFTTVPRHNYRLGVPRSGYWREMLNSDGHEFAGNGQGNLGGLNTTPLGVHGQPYSLTITLPPLAAVFFKHEKHEGNHG